MEFLLIVGSIFALPSLLTVCALESTEPFNSPSDGTHLIETGMNEYQPVQKSSAWKNETCLTRTKREININSNNDAISRLADFINENIKTYSKINLFGADIIYIALENINVNDLYSLIAIDEATKHRTLLHTGVFNVTNHAGVVFESASLPYAYPREHTVSISVKNTAGFFGHMQLPLPLINDSSPTLKFFYQPTSKISDTITETVIIPPQSVLLHPKTRRELEFNLYREELRKNYLATFLIDSCSTFGVYFRKIVYGRLIHYVNGSVDCNLLDFLKEMHEKGRKLYGPSLEYNYDSSMLLLKDYAVTRSEYNDFVEAVFGPEESL